MTNREDNIPYVSWDGYMTPEQMQEYKTMIEQKSEPVYPKWIPCSERLPEKNGEFIVSLEDCVYPWASWFNGKWFMLPADGIARDFGEHEVLAWMPLPKPYKGGDTK